MTKLEELYSNYETYVKEMQSMFKNVNVYPDRYNITEDVNININNITVSIHEKKARWSSEIVTIYFRKDWFNNGVKIEYNYGSGGWNAGDIKDQMAITAEAWTGAKHMVEFMEANSDILSEKLNVANKLYREWREAQDAEQRIEAATKKAIIEEDIREITSGFKRVTNIDQLLEAINKDETYGYGKLLKVTAWNGINISKSSFEYSKGQKTTFRHSNNRISKKDLEKLLIEGNFYVIDEKNDGIISGYGAHQTFSNKEEVLAKIK